MEREMNFKTPHGHMRIFIDTMFPCDQVRFKKIIKLVKGDFESSDQNLQLLHDYFTTQIDVCEFNRKEAVKRYFDKRQELADVERIIEDQKYPNGLPVRTKLEMDNLKERRKNVKAAYMDAESDIRRSKTLKDKYERHLKVLEGMDERWNCTKDTLK